MCVRAFWKIRSRLWNVRREVVGGVEPNREGGDFSGGQQQAPALVQATPRARRGTARLLAAAVHHLILP